MEKERTGCPRLVRALLLTLTLTLAVAFPSGVKAEGLTFFVAEEGNGDDCTAEEPCDITAVLLRAREGDTVAVIGQLTVEAPLVLGYASMRLEGFFEESSEAGLLCAVSEGACLSVSASNVTIQGLVITGACTGTCLAQEVSATSDTELTLRLVGWQEVTVQASEGVASLIRLVGSEGLRLLGSLVQECTLSASVSASTAAVIVREESAVASALSVENLFAYGKLDPDLDIPFLASLASQSSGAGPLSLIGFTFHGIDVGERVLLSGVDESQIFLANGTVNEVHARSLISSHLAGSGRFLAHELTLTHCAFTKAMELQGGAGHVPDVYLEEVELTRNTGSMLVATEANVIINSLTARENVELSIVMSGSVSMTNSAISYNSNIESPIVQITGIDSLRYRMPTPSAMLYISACDFVSNENTPLYIETVASSDARGGGLLLTTCSFSNNKATSAGALELKLGSNSTPAEVMFVAVSENRAGDDSAAVYCSSDVGGGIDAQVQLIVATFADNFPSDIGGSCAYQCTDGQGIVECPEASLPSSSDSSSTLLLLLFAFVLIAVPAAIGVCIAHRYIVARRNRALEDNLAANDNLFELEEFHHRD